MNLFSCFFFTISFFTVRVQIVHLIVTTPDNDTLFSGMSTGIVTLGGHCPLFMPQRILQDFFYC